MRSTVILKDEVRKLHKSTRKEFVDRIYKEIGLEKSTILKNIRRGFNEKHMEEITLVLEGCKVKSDALKKEE